MRFPGAAGDIETLIESPSVAPIAVAICCHPHPLFGGSMTNKVIHTVAKTFLAAGSVVIRFNFRGVGASAGVHDEGRGETDDVVALARWARERWPGLPLWLGGFSFGGYVALALLEAVPERVEGLALICTSPSADAPAARPRREAALAAIEQGRYLEFAQAQSAAAFHPDSLQDQALMAERQAMLQAYGGQRCAAHLRAAMARPDRTALLDGRHPMLVVGGSHDTLFTREALSYASQVPGCKHITIEGAGHLLPMERPRELGAALLDWMQASSRGHASPASQGSH